MRALMGVLALLLLVACGGSPAGPAPPAGPTATRAAAAFVAPTPAVTPVTLPGDEGPHDVLTEWWYYTGHLFTSDGTRYGFEYVIFHGNRAGFPSAAAAHFAITDSTNVTFTYDQRIELLQPAESAVGFDLAVGDWTMTGLDGVDHLVADMPGYAIDLALTATKPAAIHGDVGFLDLGEMGGSYYYSRTRMAVAGTLVVAGMPQQVSGEAWMDHQWGNFIATGVGGWDWFSVQLADGRDLMTYVVHDGNGTPITAFGTIIDDAGGVTELDAGEIVLTPTGAWTSPETGATYPQGWTIDLPAEAWSLTLTPSMPDQELDTRRSTGVVYWEGEVTVTGTVAGRQVAGLGYVELTGYAE